jgi:hypothetical protein
MRKQLHACNAHRGIIVIDKFGFTLNTFRLSVGCVTGAENTHRWIASFDILPLYIDVIVRSLCTERYTLLERWEGEE